MSDLASTAADPLQGVAGARGLRRSAMRSVATAQLVRFWGAEVLHPPLTPSTRHAPPSRCPPSRSGAACRRPETRPCSSLLTRQPPIQNDHPSQSNAKAGSLDSLESFLHNDWLGRVLFAAIVVVIGYLFLRGPPPEVVGKYCRPGDCFEFYAGGGCERLSRIGMTDRREFGGHVERGARDRISCNTSLNSYVFRPFGDGSLEMEGGGMYSRDMGFDGKHRLGPADAGATAP